MWQALAWWIAAEFVRRHPEAEPRIMEHHWYGVMLDVGVGGVELSLASHGHLTPHVDSCDMDQRLNWLDVLLAENRRAQVIEPLERVLGLPSPKRTPPTTRTSVGPRLLAAFFAKTALRPLAWQACCGYICSHWDDECWPVERLFAAMPAVDTDRRKRRNEADYWFICRSRDLLEPGEPVAAVDIVTGRAWSRSGTVVDLMERYEQVGRSVDALASAVLPPAN
jgi:hypothetical protein